MEGSQQFSFQSSIKSWILAFWWAIWENRNNFIWGGMAKKVIEDCSSSFGKYIPSSKRDDDGFKLRMEEDIALICADEVSYGYSIWLNNSLLSAGSLDGPNVHSSKQVEARAILFAMSEARTRGFSKAIFLSDALEIIRQLMEVIIGRSTLFCRTSIGLAYPIASQSNWL